MNEITLKALFDLDRTICASYLKAYRYPWEVLSDIGEIILKIGQSLPSEQYAYEGNQIWIAKTAQVDGNVCLNGPLIVDEGAQIRHGAFIRGNVVVGKNAVAGNSTELKNCILFDAVEVPHFNYVGDSILGFHAHLGAGAVTSNVKADRSEVVLHVGGQDGQERAELKTGRTKLGAMVGDYVEVGCNSVLNPGTIIGRHTVIYPLSMVRGYLPEECIYKKEGNFIKKIKEK